MPFTIEETAFILSHADFCQARGESLRDTTGKALEIKTGSSKTWRQIYDHFCTCWRKHRCKKRTKFTIRYFEEHGSKCLGELPGELKAKIAEYRKAWDISEEAAQDTTGSESTRETLRHDEDDQIEVQPIANNEHAVSESGHSDEEEENDDQEDCDYDLTDDEPAIQVDSSFNADKAPKPPSNRRRLIELSDDDQPAQTEGTQVARAHTPYADCTTKKRSCDKQAPYRTQSILRSKHALKAQKVPNPKKPRLSIALPQKSRTLTGDAPAVVPYDRHPPPTRHPSSLLSLGAGVESRRMVEPAAAAPPLITDEQLDQRVNDAVQKILSDGFDVQCKLLWDTVFWMMERILSSGPGIPAAIKSTVHDLKRMHRQNPNEMVGKMTERLVELETQLACMQEGLDKLTGYRDYNNESIDEPADRNDIDREWRALRRCITDVVGTESDPLTPTACVLIDAKVDELLYSNVPDDELDDWIEDFAGRIEQGYGYQIVMGAMLCRWVFGTPDAMHPDMRGEMLMESYESEKTAGGLSRVHERDKINMKLLFNKLVDAKDESQFAKGCKYLEAGMAKRFMDMAAKICNYDTPVTELTDPVEFINRAVKLKRKLMVSPLDYRIRYYRPGSSYNQLWMQAVDARGYEVVPTVAAEEAKTKRVVTCLFPAITEQKAKPFDETAGVAAALLSSKRLLPTRRERNDFSARCAATSRAVVMLG
ncbi:hypothetical protein NX059_007965 [Plenodomus lindquistii]|nr:hypothetical protein NX059_007965 [Plenodomus lindquistii]